MKITVLLTCFNRRDLTLDCLARLQDLELPDSYSLNVVLVDDGSKDGTAEAVAEQFPDVELLGGDGSLYWCGGMCKAWNHAEKRSPEYLLMLNDDTILVKDALLNLLKVLPSPDAQSIAVGAVEDPDTGDLTYGGRLRSHPSGPVPLGEEPVECDSFNGNCVLIPRAVRELVGPLCGVYTHSFADFDYGIQAVRAGVKVLQIPEVVGTCRANSSDNTWQDRSLGRIQRFKRLQSPKGMPWRDHLAFARRTQGAKWLRHFVAPYFRILLAK